VECYSEYDLPYHIPVAGAANGMKMKETPPLLQEALDLGFKVKVRVTY
jgi:hypothetical protein